jgi:DNA-binding response OmpR family regulator
VPKLLIIDDDKELSELFQDYLTQEGFAIDAAYNGKVGLEKGLSEDYQLIILDMMLPDMSGTQVLQQIRTTSHVPVLMFTAKGDDVDRIIGLESGADDYVAKPCTPRELVARVRAILRRTMTNQHNTESQTIQCGHLQICSQTRQAQWKEQDIPLTSTEFNLLYTLAEKAGQVVSKQELSEKSLGKPLSRYDRSIDVHVSSIRQKIGNNDEGRQLIQTIRGQGYQLVKS